MYKYLTKLLLAGVVAALCAVIGTPAAFAETVTGCLSNDGKLRNFAIGDDPVSPCPGSQTEVTFGAQGPPGPPGADGADGADGTDGATGPAGSPAGAFQLITHEPLSAQTNGVITSAEWNECEEILGGRPANTRDVITLPWAPAPPLGITGWVHPFTVAASPTTGVLIDISGVEALVADLSCRTSPTGVPWGEDDPGTTGLRATKGGIDLTECNNTQPIVCVVPVGP